MSRSRRIILFAFGICVSAFSQKVAPPGVFEVAEVKVNKSGSASSSIEFLPGGGLRMRNVTMKAMLEGAYHVNGNAILRGPVWLDSDCFDVVAKAAPTATEDDVRLMLRALLAERFKLEIHNEEKVLPAFVMVVDSPGKLQSDEPASRDVNRCNPGQGPIGDKHLVCRHITMQELSEHLPLLAPGYVDKPVVDQTGLTGSYQFKLDWTPRGRMDSDGGKRADTAPTVDVNQLTNRTLFQSMQLLLGLRLDSRKVSTPVIVIDRLERTPAEN